MSLVLGVPFLTELDSRAAVKGSRDPLGIQPIWTRLGRQVVGNLTTVSTSVRDFTTLLIGYWLAEQIADLDGTGSELATFLKWEQLAAYARAIVNEDYGFRGTERVRKKLAEGSAVVLSADSAHQILGNQRIYGLWGLYTVPARTSNLLEGNPPRLLDTARNLVEEHYLQVMRPLTGRNASRLVELLRKDSYSLGRRPQKKQIVAAVARILDKQLEPIEYHFYKRHLLLGGPVDTTGGSQPRLAELIGGTLSTEGFGWSTAQVRELSRAATRDGREWDELARRLSRIATSETVLAPVSALFTYLLGLDQTPTRTIAGRLREAWGNMVSTVDVEGFREVATMFAAGDGTEAERWATTAEALASGDYEALVQLLSVQNREVMERRGGAPWVDIRGGKVHVRFRDENGRLPDRESLHQLWRHPYFLDSLRSIAVQLEQNGHG